MAAMTVQEIKEQILQFINKLNEKNPYYTLGGLLFLILLVVYFGAMQFQIGNLRSLSPKLDSLKQDLVTAKNNIQRLPHFQKEVKRLNGQLEKTHLRIKTREEIPEILENISRMANKNGVKIEQIMPNTSVTEPVLKNDEGQYYSVPVIVEARAAYHNLGRFIHQLETEEIFLSIPEMTLAANNIDPRAHSVKLTINAITFEKAKK